MKKKIILFCASVLAIVLILIIVLIPRNAVVIKNAAVSPINGDIAISYMNSGIGASVIKVQIYDRNGALLYSKSFFDSGTPHMVYDEEGNLCISVGEKSRRFCYDRQGGTANSDMTVDEINAIGSFSGWKKSAGKYKYTLDGYQYIYEKPSLFNRRAKLTVSHEGTNRVIYESK